MEFNNFIAPKLLKDLKVIKCFALERKYTNLTLFIHLFSVQLLQTMKSTNCYTLLLIFT